MEFLNTLLLLIAVVGLGSLSRHICIFEAKDKRVLSAFVFNFALPALFLAKLSMLRFDVVDVEVLLVPIIPVVLTIIPLIVLRKLRVISRKALIINAVTLGFGSNAFFGLAYFDSMYGTRGLEFAVITGSILGVVGVLCTVSFYEYACKSASAFTVIMRVLRNPPVFAVAIGLLMAVFGIHISFLNKASDLVGKTAGGVAIFTLGMYIYDSYSVAMLKKALPYVLVRSFFLPIVTYGVLLCIPNMPTELYNFMFQQAGIPAAVSIAIFANRFNYHEDEVAGVVVLSSISCFGVLGILHILANMLWPI